jgi:hypothetical protein
MIPRKTDPNSPIADEIVTFFGNGLPIATPTAFMVNVESLSADPGVMEIPTLESRMASLIQADLDNVDPKTLPPMPASAQVTLSKTTGLQHEYNIVCIIACRARVAAVQHDVAGICRVLRDAGPSRGQRTVPPGMTLYLQDVPVLLLISLSVGFFFTATGLYVCRLTLSRKPREEIA